MTAFERVARAFDNPLIVKDGVSRMRTWRAPLVISLYLGLLGAFGYGVFMVTVLLSQGTHAGSAQIGAAVFQALAFFQLALISLFAPALAAGAISGERERQTFDVLLVSRISPLGIVWGKLVASLAYVLLLILTALPLFAAVFLFGGIDFEQFLLTQALTVMTAVSIGAISLLMSALFRRSLPSTVTSYAAAFAGVIGTFIAGWLLSFVIFSRQGGFGPANSDVHPLLFMSPLYALQIVLNNPNGAPMHLGRLVQLTFLATGRPSRTGLVFEPWQMTLFAELALTVISIALAVVFVRGRRPLTTRRPSEVREA